MDRSLSRPNKVKKGKISCFQRFANHFKIKRPRKIELLKTRRTNEWTAESQSHLHKLK